MANLQTHPRKRERGSERMKNRDGGANKRNKRRVRKSHVASHTEAMSQRRELIYPSSVHSIRHFSPLHSLQHIPLLLFMVFHFLLSTFFLLSLFLCMTYLLCGINTCSSLSYFHREVICDYQSHFHLPISKWGVVGKEEESDDRR